MDDSDYKVHFDYFSIDFGEELSALYGAVLEQQADFAASCVEKILQLYSTNKKGGGKSAQEWVSTGSSEIDQDCKKSWPFYFSCIIWPAPGN